MYYKWDLNVDWYQNEKKILTAELGHNDRLKIYVDISEIYVDPGFLVHMYKRFVL